jgi:tryptophan halogenase
VSDRAADRIRSIVIVGGGVTGWLAAATLARALKQDFCRIHVLDVRSLDAGAIGHAIGQATLPSFHRLTALLAIDEIDLVLKTRATFRLGAQFVDWARQGDRYLHTFGSIGARLGAVPFHQYWLKLRQLGLQDSIETFSVASSAAMAGRFAQPSADTRSVLSQYSYAYHFHAMLLAEYLREYAEDHGAACITRDIVDVKLRGEDGFIEALVFEDGTSLRADLYIDCTGTTDGLFAQKLQTKHVDWSHWLPCDRGVTIACDDTSEMAPYSRSIACFAGSQWRLPLQDCVDCGYAYSSAFLSDDEAAATLLRDLPGTALNDLRSLRFAQGRPQDFWAGNYLNLAGSCMDPLEGTGLHLVQTGIARFLTLFPPHGVSPDDAAEYNRLTIQEHERVRDFLVLHYKATTRSDSPFWNHCREMEVPGTLRDKIELFRSSGRISQLDEEHFNDDSWLAVLLGQGIDPQSYDPLADVLDVSEVRAAFSQASSAIAAAVAGLPAHRRFLEEFCGDR